MAWRKEFDEKRLASKSKSKDEGKLSGRDLFIQNSEKFNDSDLKFESTEENVEFDEALFDDLDEDLDDLDIEDDD